MKPLSYTPGKSSRIKFMAYSALLLTLVTQSCFSDKELDGSLDGGRQRFSGPSYSSASHNNLGAGVNVGFYLFGGLAGTGTTYNSTNNSSPNVHYPLYASTDKDLGSFLNPDGSLAGESSSKFTDNLLYKTGLEFVDKRSGESGSTTSLDYLEVPIYAL